MTTGIPNAGRLRKSDTENTAHIITKSPDTEAYDKSEFPDVLIPLIRSSCGNRYVHDLTDAGHFILLDT